MNESWIRSGQCKSPDSASQEKNRHKKTKISQRYQMIHYQGEGELMSCLTQHHRKTDGEITALDIRGAFFTFEYFYACCTHTHTHTELYSFLICANESRRWYNLSAFLPSRGEDSSVHRHTWGSWESPELSSGQRCVLFFYVGFSENNTMLF